MNSLRMRDTEAKRTMNCYQKSKLLAMYSTAFLIKNKENLKRKPIKTHLQGTPCITMKKAIFTFARWDNAWKRVVREKLKQSQDINKPTVAIQQRIARVVH